ncbi:hypothetical protein [Paucimonas lemoignei]|uniref:hypothetical protein n=1 Tax=Paucimonas lemoignei TaxID=29443 RepID=UPI001044F892|nr:hypothetical protein [Paucimonas lemoignei]
MLDVQEVTCLEAWQTGARKIVQGRGEAFNLITEIAQPTQLDSQWLQDYSPHRTAGVERIEDVIDTIFPISLHQRFPVRAELYSKYLTRHRRAMKWSRNRGRWGTYFERLIAFGRPEPVNQLERVIEKLTTWEQRNTTGLVFHLSSPATDAPRTRGGPCWHFGELLWHSNNVLDLVVVYRNHDYFNKALGNFIALGQLLGFIAGESGKTAGKLICHSVHAYSDKSLANLSTLARIT